MRRVFEQQRNFNNFFVWNFLILINCCVDNYDRLFILFDWNFDGGKFWFFGKNSYRLDNNIIEYWSFEWTPTKDVRILGGGKSTDIVFGPESLWKFLYKGKKEFLIEIFHRYPWNSFYKKSWPRKNSK